MILSFSVFTVLHTHTKKVYCKFASKIIGCFSEDIKVRPSHNVLNWLTSNWLLFDILYVHSMGLKYQC